MAVIVGVITGRANWRYVLSENQEGRYVNIWKREQNHNGAREKIIYKTNEDIFIDIKTNVFNSIS